MTETVLELKNVSKSFPVGRHRRNFALNQVDLRLYKGETLGLVGESGCGKSTLARVIMGVYPPSAGEVLFHGESLKLRSQKQRKAFARQAQMIFQDPYTSLDPHMTVEAIVGENLKIHQKLDAENQRRRIVELLEMTGLSKTLLGRFPHEFSGGQRQRIGIARALAVNPEFVICDEPVSALDLSIQSQIMNLLIHLKETLGLTYLFISHDLNIVNHFSDRIAVMYAGRIVELGDADKVYRKPKHPYTRMLLNAVLTPDPNNKIQPEQADGAQGELTGSWEADGGCPFVGRCPMAEDRCSLEVPGLTSLEPGHEAACHVLKRQGAKEI